MAAWVLSVSNWLTSTTNKNFEKSEMTFQLTVLAPHNITVSSFVVNCNCSKTWRSRPQSAPGDFIFIERCCFISCGAIRLLSGQNQNFNLGNRLGASKKTKTMPFYKYNALHNNLTPGYLRTEAISVNPNVTNCDIGCCWHREVKLIFVFFRIFVSGGWLVRSTN